MSAPAGEGAGDVGADSEAAAGGADSEPERAVGGRSALPTLIAALLVLAGLGVAGYLTYVHYEGIAPVCTTGGCERVQASEYSELAGVPVALLGLIGYVLIGASLFLRGDVGRVATFFLALVGFMFSLYLTYLELFVIDAICQWCVASAVLMTGLFLVSIWRLLRAT